MVLGRFPCSEGVGVVVLCPEFPVRRRREDIRHGDGWLAGRCNDLSLPNSGIARKLTCFAPPKLLELTLLAESCNDRKTLEHALGSSTNKIRKV